MGLESENQVFMGLEVLAQWLSVVLAQAGPQFNVPHRRELASHFLSFLLHYIFVVVVVASQLLKMLMLCTYEVIFKLEIQT